MEGVVLLSELHPHPHARRLFDPLKQAVDWFELLTTNDIAELQIQGIPNYSKMIALIEQRCRARGETLVLRDWAHLDYTGPPFVNNPGYSPLLFDELSEYFDIIRISITRDPVTQWLSLIRTNAMHEPLHSGEFGLDEYISGYRKYAELCVKTGFVRYEDFIQKPQLVMRKLCKHLQIKYDLEFINKWPDYKTITGDIDIPRGSSKIKMPAKKSIDADFRKQIRENEDYYYACELLGYSPLKK
jgi:hypothetical protein